MFGNLTAALELSISVGICRWDFLYKANFLYYYNT